MNAADHEIAKLRAQNRMLRAQLAERDQESYGLRSENDVLRAKLTALERRMERMRRRIYGKSSERHHPGQQRIEIDVPRELDDDAPIPPAETPPDQSDQSAGSQAKAPAAAAGEDAKQKRSRAGRHPGRRALPADAEIVEEDVTVPEHERLDADGRPLPLLGWRTTDKWDYRVGTYLIRRFRRAIYGRPFSEAADRVVAPAPACLIPLGKMTDAAVIHTVVEKFADHLPLYRQQAREARAGIHLSRATLVSHVTAMATAFRPVYEAIAERVRRSPLVHLDDTPVKLLEPGRGQCVTARIWVYRSAHETAFQFAESREGRHPAEFLGDYRGYIVADAYAGHECLYGPGRATAVGCWAHVRRKFYEILEHEPVAGRMVDEIRRLYQIEDDVRLVDDEERRRARQERSVPILSDIRRRLTAALATALPESDLGKALAYADTRWPTLIRFAKNGLLPIDNNPAENALRPWAIGRKNWLFLGSRAGGERAATISTLIENCRFHGLDPYEYLIDAVKALHRGVTDYDALTPRAMAANSDRAIA